MMTGISVLTVLETLFLQFNPQFPPWPDNPVSASTNMHTPSCSYLLNVSRRVQIFSTPCDWYRCPSTKSLVYSITFFPQLSFSTSQFTKFFSYTPRLKAYCYALGPILLARASNVLIFCLIWLMWPDYVYHWFTWRPYQTFLLSRYLAALDSLTCLGSPSYLGLHSHGRATPFGLPASPPILACMSHIDSYYQDIFYSLLSTLPSIGQPMLGLLTHCLSLLWLDLSVTWSSMYI